MNARVIAVVAALILPLGIAGCQQKPCTGHREVRVTQKPHYTADARGRLRYAGTRPQAETVCVPAQTTRTEATR